MSTFASIAVLSKPTEMHPDWEFEMEGLKFEVHDGMIELNQEIRDFERFCSSVLAIDNLVSNIDFNRGRLDEAVYTFVNQNNELAEALGIYTPFSFATEEEQAQAGQEVKEATTSGDEKKGFFARAWEAIKKFFKSIGDAIGKVWNKLTGGGTAGVDNEVRKLSDTVNNGGPELDEEFKIKVGESAHQGLKYTSKEITNAITAINTIAKDLSAKYPTGSFDEILKIVIDPSGQFIDEAATEQLLTSFHYKSDDSGNVIPVEPTKESQEYCLLDYGIDRGFCQNFVKIWENQIKIDLNKISAAVGRLKAGIDKSNNDEGLKKLTDEWLNRKENIVKSSHTNFDKPKRGLGNKFKRGWGLLVSLFNEKAGARIEREGYTKTGDKLHKNNSNERVKVAMAAGQMQLALVSNTLKITQIALKDIRAFVKSINDLLDTLKTKKGADSTASSKIQKDYRKDFEKQYEADHGGQKYVKPTI